MSRGSPHSASDGSQSTRGCVSLIVSSWSENVFRKLCVALADVAQLEGHPVHQGVAGSIPSKHVRGVIDCSFSSTCMFFSLSFFLSLKLVL